MSTRTMFHRNGCGKMKMAASLLELLHVLVGDDDWHIYTHREREAE
jgi:serine kinase of HPr protein (carbohydrate metabolism regulator)